MLTLQRNVKGQTWEVILEVPLFLSFILKKKTTKNPACRLQAFHSFEEIGQKCHKKETFLPSMKTREKRRT